LQLKVSSFRQDVSVLRFSGKSYRFQPKILPKSAKLPSSACDFTDLRISCQPQVAPPTAATNGTAADKTQPQTAATADEPVRSARKVQKPREKSQKDRGRDSSSRRHQHPAAVDSQDHQPQQLKSQAVTTSLQAAERQPTAEDSRRQPKILPISRRRQPQTHQIHANTALHSPKTEQIQPQSTPSTTRKQAHQHRLTATLPGNRPTSTD
jgi:hypothetical protein